MNTSRVAIRQTELARLLGVSVYVVAQWTKRKILCPAWSTGQTGGKPAYTFGGLIAGLTIIEFRRRKIAMQAIQPLIDKIVETNGQAALDYPYIGVYRGELVIAKDSDLLPSPAAGEPLLVTSLTGVYHSARESLEKLHRAPEVSETKAQLS